MGTDVGVLLWMIDRGEERSLVRRREMMTAIALGLGGVTTIQ
jgi:hypothetical protein